MKPMANTHETVPSLGVVRVLRDAWMIPQRNQKVTLSILLTLLLLCALNSLAVAISMDATIGDLFQHFFRGHYRSDVVVLRDMQSLICLVLLFAPTSAVVSMFSFVTTVNAASMSYREKHFAMHDVVERFKSTWTSPVITGMFILLMFSAVAPCLILVLMPLAFLGRYGAAVIGATSFVVLHFYFANVWMLAMVISVTESEKDLVGMEAIAKAGKVICGRELHGGILVALMTLFSFMDLAVVAVLGGAAVFGMAIRLAVEVAVACILLVLKLFLYVAYTVFYYECRSRADQVPDAEDFVGLTTVHVEKSF